MSDTRPFRIYIDTNVFILLVEGEPKKAEATRALFSTLKSHSGRGFTSELTFAEVLAPARRPGALELHIKRRLYLSLILWSGFIDLIPVSRDILIETADLRQAARHKLPDAIHVVSAIRAECTHFLSADADAKRIPSGMAWIKPDEEGVSQLRGLLLD